MAIRPILPITDPLLRQKSAEIEAIDDSVRDLVSDMLETMQDADGAGLAAVQIGELRRILVADIPLDEPHASHKVFINPEIIWQSDEIDRKSTRLNSSHVKISYAVFCLKKKQEHSPPSHI